MPERDMPVIPYKVFGEGKTVVWRNVPSAEALPATDDGLRIVKNVEISTSGVVKARFDMMTFGQRSDGKEKEGYPSADQLLFEWLTPSQCAVFLGDGRKFPFFPEYMIPYEAEAIFPSDVLARYEENSKESLRGIKIPPDAYSAISITKMFPYSDEWENLKANPEKVRARDILIAADAFKRNILPAWTLNTPFKSPFIPASIGSVALFDFDKFEVTTAHIGDTTMGYLEIPGITNKGMEETVTRLGYVKPVVLSKDQGEEVDTRLERERTELGLQGEVLQWHLLKSYEKKDNNRVGLVNGSLNPHLIIERTIPFEQILAFYIYTDGVKFGNPWSFPSLMCGLYLNPQEGLRKLRILREATQKSGLYSRARDDDFRLFAMFFHNSPHFHLGRDPYFQSWMEFDKKLISFSLLRKYGSVEELPSEPTLLSHFIFNPETGELEPQYLCDFGWQINPV